VKIARVTDQYGGGRTLLEVSNQQIEGRGGIVEARVSLEQPGAPEEREEDDRGRGGAL